MTPSRRRTRVSRIFALLFAFGASVPAVAQDQQGTHISVSHPASAKRCSVIEVGLNSAEGHEYSKMNTTGL